MFNKTFRIFSFLFLLNVTVKAQNPPIWKFTDLEKQLNKAEDTLYIVNFWATWCRPCVKELPYFDDIESRFSAYKIRVLLVNLDFVDEYESKLLPFLKKKQTTPLVVLLDEPKYNTWLDKISPDWSGAIPATLFYQAKSNFKQFHEGEFEQQQLYETIQNIIDTL